MKDKKELLKYLKNITVLYVEDDKNTREELVFFLENRVEKLYVGTNGEEGVELFKKHQPDLIISDIQMPVLNGIDMVKKIKEINPNVPVILITAFNDSDYLFKAIQLNISNYLTKPLNLNQLIDVSTTIAKSIFLEKENQEIFNTLSQYKDIVDERSIISKADENGIITYVNKPFEEISGYSKEELIGKSHNIVSHPNESKELFTQMWQTIKVDKKVWKGRLKNRNKNGKEYFVDIIIKPILDLENNIIEFISLSNDITDLENTKEYFKHQTQKTALDLNESIRIANSYEQAINESNIILRIDLNRNIIFANDAFCKISSYSKDELVGKHYGYVKHAYLSEEDWNKELDNIFINDIWKGRMSNIAKDGSIFHCNVTLFPLKDKNGNIIEYMGIRHDITEIENLHAELEDTQREIIYKLGEIGETRSKETGNHVKRVAEYSKLLAIKSNLPQNEINILFSASPMHDIGKVGIPDSILNKPSKLEKDEWETMKTHAEIGYNILRYSKRPILKAAALVSYSHHEKWDGSGYSLGLKGEEIHIFGRITAIADVFDALGSNRIYKEAWALERILELFKEQRGKHFDPTLVDIFLNNLDDFLEIRNKYKD